MDPDEFDSGLGHDDSELVEVDEVVVTFADNDDVTFDDDDDVVIDEAELM